MRGLIKYLLGFFITGSVFGQHYTTSFGQNRIQYKSFDWYYYSTNNFDIYYIPGGKEYALEAIDFLEDEYLELTDRLGYAPYNKTKIFIYNSIHDLQQSNIGIDGAVYTIGGRTDFVKLELEIAYPGQAKKFKEDLIYQLTSALINDMMYGGSLGEIFQNSYLLTLPEWFIDGASRYMAYGWSREMDDFIRDWMSNKKIKKLTRVDGKSAVIIGQSIWNYIAVRYGESNISNILNLTRIIRKEENSIANTLGISFKTFIEEWKNYYLNQKNEVQESYKPLSKEAMIGKIPKSKELITTSVSFNKDADKIAYALLKKGRYEIYVRDIQKGKTKRIDGGGFHINGQETDQHLPLLDWQDEYTLGAVIFRGGFLYLNTYHLESGRKKQKPLNRFRQIENFSFNDNGKLAVISGDIDGQNDLFLIAMNRNALRRITRDVYDDLDPTFVPGTAAIVFSSNRVIDSIRVSDASIESVEDHFNLFVYDLDTTTNQFYRITNKPSVNRKPYAKNTHEIYYLSDQKGIMNLYKHNLRDSLDTQLTNFDRNIISYDLHFDPDRLVFSALSKSRKQLFVYENPDLSQHIFTPETPRIRRKNALLVVNKIIRNNPPKKPEKTQKPLVDEQPKNVEEVNDFSFEDKKEDRYFEDPTWLDTDNYHFEDEPEQVIDNESFFAKYFSYKEQNERIGPMPYNPKFSFNNVITSFLWDPYRKFMIFTETEVNDILENYKIKVGALIKADLKEGDIFAEFHYLKYWMDFKFRYDRSTYLQESTADISLYQKYIMNRFQTTAALPLTHSLRLEASPILTSTSFFNLNYLNVTNAIVDQVNNSKNTYLGGQASLVFDTKIEDGFNIYHGSVGRIEYTSHFNPSDAGSNFSTLRVDLRHYQKIHKEITWATRIFYGKQMGPAAKKFMLGGMDNWLGADFTNHGDDPENPVRFTNDVDNSDIFFNEFVTNLRGLDYNEAFGTDALVVNTELRLPIFRYLSNGPIKSNFLRNFQMITFADLGSVWTGDPPFSDGRTISRRFNRPPFEAEIVQFQNPWLGGFGYGIRTVLLGYYLKVDAARPYLDGETGNYRFYFTLGLDF